MGNCTTKKTDVSLSKDNSGSKQIDQIAVDDGNREDYHNNVDVLFVLDTTSSMGSYISPAIKTIKTIIESFSKMEFNIKFSLCTYRDHPPQDSSYVYEFHELSADKKMIEILSKVSVSGGGDGPEAVMDGLREGISQTKWRVGDDEITPSKRFLFHICDAPPHGKEYGGQSSDSSWQKNGCPCGTKKEDIATLLQKHNVLYHLIKAVSEVDKMEKLFKQCFKQQYAETIKLDPNTNYVDHEEPKYEERMYEECIVANDVMDCNYDMDAQESLNNRCAEKLNLECEVKETRNQRFECKSEKKEMMAMKSCASSKNNMWDGVVTAMKKRL